MSKLFHRWGKGQDLPEGQAGVLAGRVLKGETNVRKGETTPLKSETNMRKGETNPLKDETNMKKGKTKPSEPESK